MVLENLSKCKLIKKVKKKNLTINTLLKKTEDLEFLLNFMCNINNYKETYEEEQLKLNIDFCNWGINCLSKFNVKKTVGSDLSHLQCIRVKDQETYYACWNIRYWKYYDLQVKLYQELKSKGLAYDKEDYPGPKNKDCTIENSVNGEVICNGPCHNFNLKVTLIRDEFDMKNYYYGDDISNGESHKSYNYIKNNISFVFSWINQYYNNNGEWRQIFISDVERRGCEVKDNILPELFSNNDCDIFYSRFPENNGMLYIVIRFNFNNNKKGYYAIYGNARDNDKTRYGGEWTLKYYDKHTIVRIYSDGDDFTKWDSQLTLPFNNFTSRGNYNFSYQIITDPSSVSISLKNNWLSNMRNIIHQEAQVYNSNSSVKTVSTNYVVGEWSGSPGSFKMWVNNYYSRDPSQFTLWSQYLVKKIQSRFPFVYPDIFCLKVQDNNSKR